MTLPETIRSTTANGAKYWAVALPDGDYKWYAVPRTVGTGRADESQLGITVESYVATGRFISNESLNRLINRWLSQPVELTRTATSRT